MEIQRRVRKRPLVRQGLRLTRDDAKICTRFLHSYAGARGEVVGPALKILIVEDDALIAMELAERVAEMGRSVLGPAHSVAEAEQLIATERPVAALLDLNLAGQSSIALGLTLAGLGVPVAFCTGYDRLRDAPAELANAPLLTKPVGSADLRDCLAKLMPD